MAVRNDDATIKAFYPHVPASIASTDPYAIMANGFVNLYLSDKGLTEELLTQIELLVTAHYIEITIFRGGLKTYQVGESKESYNTPTGASMGLLRTSYGQSAIEMDLSGTLRNASKDRNRAEFKVIRTGKVVDEHYR